MEGIYNPKNPIIVQGDKSILLEVDNPKYEAARDYLNRFAELVKSPEHIHTYRITSLSLWNAAASGMTSKNVIESLEKFSKYDIPGNVLADINDYISRYGRLKLEKRDGLLILTADDPILLTEIYSSKKVRPYIIQKLDDLSLEVNPAMRGHIKKALTEIGFPAKDLAGYTRGEYLQVDLREITASGMEFSLRDYQIEAVDSFYQHGSVHGGSGTIVLPCGAGKTMIGMGVISRLKCSTLIISPNITGARQWIAELVDKMDLRREDIGEYSGEVKEIRPITIATYQIISYRRNKRDSVFPHFTLFDSRNWGLIIYDEVHLLPAPVFRITAEIQATRRLGLTATLVREDGREEDVFALIGPKKYDAPWKDLEKQGWIAEAVCREIRIPMPDDIRLRYATAHDRSKYRIAAENPKKYEMVKKIVAHHQKSGDKILVIGMYLDQLKKIAKMLDAPILTGTTSNRRRGVLYDLFREGEQDILVVSKVANFAVDMPDANVAVQVSGTFGSRQEEAQRLGRILRPKKDGSPARFYTIVTKDTKDQDFAAKRQMFLTEQGYRYEISRDFSPPEMPAQSKGGEGEQKG